MTRSRAVLAGAAQVAPSAPRCFLRSIIITAALLTAGCALVWPTDRPMQRWDYFYGERPSKTLIVFLPGVFDSAQKFERYGFVQAVRRHRVQADIVAVDAHVRYYGAGLIVERLRQDVIEPARRRGYTSIWLVGISLGGYGALLYARAYARHIDGIVLMAPFLGNGSGGRFDPAERMDEVNNEGDDLWVWLRKHLAQGDSPPLIFLTYGAQDKFAGINDRLAHLMPAEHVERLPGRHNWQTWRQLWVRVLERGWLAPVPSKAFDRNGTTPAPC